MKCSQFNVYAYKGGYGLVANLASSSVVMVSKEVASTMEKTSQSECMAFLKKYPKVLNHLQEKGMIVEKERDELKQLSQKLDDIKKTPDVLSFWIATTMQCNFACPYCFEERDSIVMDKAVQDATLAYIESQISEKTKALQVAWYGGEPTLTPSIMYEMSEKLIEMAEKHGVSYGAAIITNGYLLDEEMLKQFKKCKLGSIQITIDGSKNTHDNRRYLRGKQPTYDVIMKNLKRASEMGFQIKLRVNVDKHNAHEFEQVKKEVGNLPGVICYSALINDASTQDEQELSRHFTAEDSYEQFKTIDISKTSITDVMKMHSTCGAMLGHGFVIHPTGTLFCCSSDISYPDRAVGSVLTPSKGVTPRYDMSYMWEKGGCGSCPYLPVCWGGCPKEYYDAHMLKCSYVKDMLPKVMDSVLEEKVASSTSA